MACLHEPLLCLRMKSFRLESVLSWSGSGLAALCHVANGVLRQNDVDLRHRVCLLAALYWVGLMTPSFGVFLL